MLARTRFQRDAHVKLHGAFLGHRWARGTHAHRCPFINLEPYIAMRADHVFDKEQRRTVLASQMGKYGGRSKQPTGK
jgi:hypothetical protein